MKLTDEGRDLIRTFEGFRPNAYVDAAGVLTIGYGHTSMAGPPMVDGGMEITRDRAERILETDLQRFAAGLDRLLHRDLSDNQYSALLSFAYNVGLANVAKSSVLAAINRGEFNAVPRRLALWVKAGGQTLPGLIRRRAAEAAMFSGGPQDISQPQPPRGKSILASRTLLATLVAALAMLLQSMTGAVFWLFTILILIALGVIAYERLKKLKQECI